MKLTVRHLQTPIRHQYDRPTCVAFAVTAFHEYVRDCSKSGKQIPDLDLSEEFLFHHCKQLDRLPTTKSGTTLEAAAAALRHAGQALEILCPYRTGTASRSPLVLIPEITADAKTRTLSGIHKLNLSLGSIEHSLRSANPVIAVLDWYSNSYLATQGRIGLPGAADRLLGRHAVLIVEIDDEAEAGACSLGFKNSWGPKWGNLGFGSFSAQYFRSYGRELWSLTSS
ncbi:MAG: C1 family peptidase [Bryobacteraceae bacterium]